MCSREWSHPTGLAANTVTEIPKQLPILLIDLAIIEVGIHLGGGDLPVAGQDLGQSQVA
jgi:hypothetical protein